MAMNKKVKRGLVFALAAWFLICSISVLLGGPL